MNEYKKFWDENYGKNAFFELLESLEKNVFNGWKIPRSIPKKVEKKEGEEKPPSEAGILKIFGAEPKVANLDPTAFCRGDKCTCARGDENWVEEREPQEWEKILNIWREYDLPDENV